MTDQSNQPAVREDFHKLIATYKQLLNVCYEALGPGISQQQRNMVRKELSRLVNQPSYQP
mgnify:CR=1 FL=1